MNEEYIINQFASYDAIISDMGKDIGHLKRMINAMKKEIGKLEFLIRNHEGKLK